MKNTNVIGIKKIETFIDDPISDILRQGARQILTAALEASTTVLATAFQLCHCVPKRWIKLHHPELLGEIIRGIKFVDGIFENRIAA